MEVEEATWTIQNSSSTIFHTMKLILLLKYVKHQASYASPLLLREKTPLYYNIYPKKASSSNQTACYREIWQEKTSSK